MCDKLMRLDELIEPDPSVLGTIVDDSIVGGLLFHRLQDFACRFGFYYESPTQSHIYIVTVFDSKLFKVFSPVVERLARGGYIGLVQPEIRTCKSQGPMLQLTAKGYAKVVNDWFPATATDEDRRSALVRAGIIRQRQL